MILSSLKKYKYIFCIILILIISAVLYFTFNKPALQDSLFFKANKYSYENSEKQATAATLFLAPTKGNFYVGDTISVSLLVDAPSQSINALEGKITFPSDKLEVINISKTDSIITLWAQEPIFSSNQNSFIVFSGGLPSPGFIGPTGLIITISFKVKGEGNATIDVEDGQVLANDGYGTNILATTTPTRLTLLKPKIKKEITDINGDNRVDLFDVSILLSNWGIPKDQRADLNGDGKVNIKDFSIILSKWTH
jgi:hypothetical protein